MNKLTLLLLAALCGCGGITDHNALEAVQGNWQFHYQWYASDGLNHWLPTPPLYVYADNKRYISLGDSLKHQADYKNIPQSDCFTFETDDVASPLVKWCVQDVSKDTLRLEIYSKDTLLGVMVLGDW